MLPFALQGQKPEKPKTNLIATAAYIYDHHDHTVAERLMALQHDHHDLVVATQHIHLDHDHCLETVVLRGPLKPVRQFAEQLLALRGVHHGRAHFIPLKAGGHPHAHPHNPGDPHSHLAPAS